ncbi:MAG: triose-phosphate isomerase [Syntrophomonadaceae bacterium]|nr:triose-phosphate isomerase [Syntrophomonadaceae bacterium]
MRIPMVAGNWKMYKVRAEAEAFVQDLRAQITHLQDVEVVICPPYTLLESVIRAVQGSPFQVGAQNVYWEEQGAFTGEVAPSMLYDLGCRYVICGHSERRQYFGETDETVNRRLKAALGVGLIPIFCLGETLEERETGVTFQVCERQLINGLHGLTGDQITPIVVAYEPVWAIGTGRNATPQDAQEVISYLRGRISEKYSSAVGEQVRILYGGSVKPENIQALMAEPDLDGVLVGGASLEAASFARIIQYG